MPRGHIAFLFVGLTACQFDPAAPALNKTLDATTERPDAGTAIAGDAGETSLDASTADTGTNPPGDSGLPPPTDAGLPPDSGMVIVPSNGIPSDTLAESAAAFQFNATMYVDTDTGQIVDANGATLRAAGTGIDQTTGVGFREVAQAIGPTIGVFTVNTMTIGAAGSLRAFGANALALVAGGDIDVIGVIDVRGGTTACGPFELESATCAGPGAGVAVQQCPPCCAACGIVGPSCYFCDGTCSCTACAPTFAGDGAPGSTGDGVCFGEAGGGGGAHGTNGGDGGDGSTVGLYIGGGGVVTSGGTGGQAYATSDLIPLTGGGGGGTGASEGVAVPGAGGGGGGAVQIVSGTRIRFASPATCGVNAGGGGGGASAPTEGGGGGGAGGGILIEAPLVILHANCVLAANGGGGSGGHGAEGAESGALTTASAVGTDPVNCEGGAGGHGASFDDPSAENADDGPFDCGGDRFTLGSGGGGGGLGVIHVNHDAFMNGGATSPTATEGSLRRVDIN